MYQIQKSIDLDFAHFIAGHQGACINLHGHTWKMEVCLEAPDTDGDGFVWDFKKLKTCVLQPVHTLLDHSLCLGLSAFSQMREHLVAIGKVCLATRPPRLSNGDLGYTHLPEDYDLAGAKNVICGGIKISVMPFQPTSEGLARWLWDVANRAIHTPGNLNQFHPVGVAWAQVTETLHPVKAVATYHPGGRVLVEEIEE